jgi:hypothetical protein
MTDKQYQICITVLFMYVAKPLSLLVCANVYSRPYMAAELPANLLLRRIGPQIMLPTLLTLWGIIVTLQGKL